MSEMSELDLTVKELRSAARSLTAVADNLTALFSTSSEEPAISEATVSKKEKVAPKSITLEQVRSVLAEKSRGGHTAEVRELLGRHGANKLSEINPAEYPALLAEAAEIGLTEGESNG